MSKLIQGELAVKMRCPFCDGQGRLGWILREGHENAKDDPDAKAYFIRCKSCAAEGGWSKSPSGALKMWNMRQQKPTVTREWFDLWVDHLYQQKESQTSKLLRTLLAELSVEVIE